MALDLPRLTCLICIHLLFFSSICMTVCVIHGAFPIEFRTIDWRFGFHNRQQFKWNKIVLAPSGGFIECSRLASSPRWHWSLLTCLIIDTVVANIMAKRAELFIDYRKWITPVTCMQFLSCKNGHFRLNPFKTC